MAELRIEHVDWLLTLDRERRIVTDGAVDVERGRIAACHPGSETGLLQDVLRRVEPPK